MLHGQDLPAGYVKVAINAVDENVVSWPTLKSDEYLLTSEHGQLDLQANCDYYSACIVLS